MLLNDNGSDGLTDHLDDKLRHLWVMQKNRNIQFVTKEGELLLLIKQEPSHPVKYYMNKSGMSSRWFNEVLKKLLEANLVKQERCSRDSRRKLLS